MNAMSSSFNDQYPTTIPKTDINILVISQPTPPPNVPLPTNPITLSNATSTSSSILDHVNSFIAKNNARQEQKLATMLEANDKRQDEKLAAIINTLNALASQILSLKLVVLPPPPPPPPLDDSTNPPPPG